MNTLKIMICLLILPLLFIDPVVSQDLEIENNNKEKVVIRHPNIVKINSLALWTNNRKHYPMEDILFV